VCCDVLGVNVFEGFGLLSSGVVYYGDELGFFSDVCGGVYYKFIFV